MARQMDASILPDSVRMTALLDLYEGAPGARRIRERCRTTAWKTLALFALCRPWQKRRDKKDSTGQDREVDAEADEGDCLDRQAIAQVGDGCNCAVHAGGGLLSVLTARSECLAGEKSRD